MIRVEYFQMTGVDSKGCISFMTEVESQSQLIFHNLADIKSTSLAKDEIYWQI